VQPGPAARGKTPIFLRKTRAESDYSEGRKGTQGQNPQKSAKTATFFNGMCKTPDFKR
jgi:hypothetical protein